MIFLTRKYFFGDNLTRFHFVKRPGEKFKSFTRSISFWLENLRPLSNAINSKWAVMLWFIGLKFHFERNHNDSSYFLLPFLFILLIFLRLLYIFSRDKWLASRWMKELFFCCCCSCSSLHILSSARFLMMCHSCLHFSFLNLSFYKLWHSKK